MNTQYTDTQLKQALAKMLPDKLMRRFGNWRWLGVYRITVPDTELLHLCWLVEESLTNDQWFAYHLTLIMLTKPSATCVADSFTCHSSWQQRTIALAKVKGVEIV